MIQNNENGKALLKKLMPKVSDNDADDYLPYFEEAFEHAQINTTKRLAMFIAQIGHESGSLKFREEIWTNSDAQKRYEQPSKVASRLGNIEKGDGYRFRGRGPIQLTGRANYRLHGKRLKIDILENPDMVKEPRVGLLVSADFWNIKTLNINADLKDVAGATRKINGGLNGFSDRLARYKHACNVLGIRLA